MKVIYIFADQTSSVGVFEKVKAKIEGLNKLGVECKGLFFRFRNSSPVPMMPEQASVVTVERQSLPAYYNRRFLRKIKALRAKDLFDATLISAIDKALEHETFDVLLFRYPLASSALEAFTRKYRNRFVFEHNADELFVFRSEHEQKRTLYSWYLYHVERKYGPRCTSNALGLIAVGFEAMAFQQQRSGLPASRCCMIANGIPVPELTLRTPPAYDGTHLNIIFLTGSPRPVDGIDLILQGLRDYKGKEEITIYVAGPISELYEENVKKFGLTDRVVFTGMLIGHELDGVFNKCHVALGTMALHRRGLKEHSALKVLEYVARGIPYAASYDDTNFVGLKEMEPYFLRLEPGERPVDMARVVEFAGKVMADSTHPEKLRDIAMRHLDVQVKMNQLREFLEKLMPEKIK